MFDQTFQTDEWSPDLDREAAEGVRVLGGREIEEVSGGFICGGLCVAGLAFGAGALFGAGLAIGWHSEK